MNDFREIAARLAAAFAKPSYSAGAAKAIQDALSQAYDAGRADGREEAAMAKDRKRERTTFPASLERVDWAGVVRAGK